ncbi:hypothetical protein I302_106788 [Kwoniella bestiolae CBS 10118]|uniref:DUF6534 domain-containing protein n=1 Tax=Kwoniella bestiolae CBS 10118 TaxID=1296100 RepID=A0A1B9G0E9_9TREE|nr:hypothetical protein I302_05947 [Kwoniella bestiolae CBS 10118]OCF24487.1 hypothetical protein I302_05947 [Kwoniella bestiolae CBS 10118]
MSIPTGILTDEQKEMLAAGAFGADKGFNLGLFLMGCVYDAILFGVLTQQYIDWWRYSEATERRTIKWVTHWIMFASVGWTATVIWYTMRSFVYYFGRYIVFTFIDIALAWPIIGITMAAPVQVFYAFRSYRLNGDNIFLLGLFLIMIAAEVAITVVIVIKATPLQTIFDAGMIQEIVRAWQVVSMSTDLLMTSTLAWGLWRSRTGWSHTDALVKKLLLITVETQLAPTCVMLAFVISWSFNPTSTLGIFFDLAIPKAYTVGYLATLNSRYSLRREQASNGQKYSAETKTNTYALGGSRLQQATVQVDTETYIESFQMQPTRSGINRDPQQLYEVKEHHDEDESIENLDYATNLSKKNLHDSSMA